MCSVSLAAISQRPHLETGQSVLIPPSTALRVKGQEFPLTPPHPHPPPPPVTTIQPGGRFRETLFSLSLSLSSCYVGGDGRNRLTTTPLPRSCCTCSNEETRTMGRSVSEQTQRPTFQRSGWRARVRPSSSAGCLGLAGCSTAACLRACVRACVSAVLFFASAQRAGPLARTYVNSTGVCGGSGQCVRH